MGMLDRYKKKGGFVQLLSLLETFGKEKQEKFFKMIEEEDLMWARAVRAKTLTVSKVLGWDDNTIAEIMGSLNDLTVAILTVGVDEKTKERMYKMMDNGRKRKIDFILTEKKPNAAEVTSTFMQMITEVRKMIQEGYLRLDKIDPELHIPSDFEEKLLSGLLFLDGDSSQTEVCAEPIVDTPVATTTPASGSSSDPAMARELDLMRRKVVQLSGENETLKEKLKIAESKLDQIKKIA